jgi:hypothetical protein
MTSKTELDELLKNYERAIGMGNMKVAGRTLPQIIHALVAFVEERTPTYMERRVFHIDVDDMSPEVAKAHLDEIMEDMKSKKVIELPADLVSPTEPPCEPCDMSITDNPELIEEFKAPTKGSVEAPDGSGRKADYVIEAGLAEKAKKDGIDLVAEVENALKADIAKEIELEKVTENVVIGPVVGLDEDVDVAQKETKKSKTK